MSLGRHDAPGAAFDGAGDVGQDFRDPVSGDPCPQVD